MTLFKQAPRSLLTLALCLLLVGCALSEPPAPVEVPAPPAPPARAAECLGGGPFPPLLAGLRYGVNAFLFETDEDRALALTQAAGFGWVRQQIHWRDIETSPRRYDWGRLDAAVEAANRAGARLLLSVVRSPGWATASGQGGLPDDPALLGAFMRDLAAR